MTPDVKAFVANLRLTGSVLEVGSYDVNGNVRGLFPEYLGLDMREGPNVDIVAEAAHLPFISGVFDNVLCLEMIEHDKTFWLSIAEMKRVLKSGGALVITVPSYGFPKHDYPSDYYRFSDAAIAELLSDMEDVHVMSNPEEHRVYAICRKP